MDQLIVCDGCDNFWSDALALKSVADKKVCPCCSSSVFSVRFLNRAINALQEIDLSGVGITVTEIKGL